MFTLSVSKNVFTTENCDGSLVMFINRYWSTLECSKIFYQVEYPQEMIVYEIWNSYVFGFCRWYSYITLLSGASSDRIIKVHNTVTRYKKKVIVVISPIRIHESVYWLTLFFCIKNSQFQVYSPFYVTCNSFNTLKVCFGITSLKGNNCVTNVGSNINIKIQQRSN